MAIVPTPKPIYASVTLYGAVLTLFGMALRTAGIDADAQLSQLQDLLPTIVQVIGIAVVIYGRVRKHGAQPITEAQALSQTNAVLGVKDKP